MSTLGERFADAIISHDAEALSALIADEVDFRGLTPKRSWEATDPPGVVDAVLGNWFEETDLIRSGTRAEAEPVSDTSHVSYRLEIDNEDGRTCGRAAGVLPRGGRPDRLDAGAVLGVPSAGVTDQRSPQSTDVLPSASVIVRQLSAMSSA